MHDVTAAAPSGPYADLAGEFIACTAALFSHVITRRPDLANMGGAVVCTFDGEARTVTLALAQPSGALVLIERVLCDPKQPATFGDSALPTQEVTETRH